MSRLLAATHASEIMEIGSPMATLLITSGRAGFFSDNFSPLFLNQLLTFFETGEVSTLVRKETSSESDENNETNTNPKYHWVPQIIDYLHRPKELTSISIYYFIRCYKKVKMLKKKVNYQYRFSETHPQFSSHGIKIRANFVIPLVFGPRFPDNR